MQFDGARHPAVTQIVHVESAVHASKARPRPFSLFWLKTTSELHIHDNGHKDFATTLCITPAAGRSSKKTSCQQLGSTFHQTSRRSKMRLELLKSDRPETFENSSG